MKTYIKWNLYTLLFTSLLFLSGCGGDAGDVEDGTAITYDEAADVVVISEAKKVIDIPLLNEDCVEVYYQDNITPILYECFACHISGGVAQDSGLVFATSNKRADFITIKSYILSNNRKIIEQADGTLEHPGKILFNASDVDKMNVLVDYISNPTQCKVSATSSIRPSNVVLADPQKTLATVASTFLGRMPTQRELDMAVNDTGLDKVVDEYMKTKAFNAWIRRSFNDFLLTDSTLKSNYSITALRYAGYGDTRWYDDMTENSDRSINDLRSAAVIGAAKAPLELVVNVIQKDRSFSEILTADYTMVNSYSARSMSLDMEGFTFPDDGLMADYPADVYKEVKLKGVPHAGLLTDIMFLSQFPTTSTNRNMHRSAKVQKFFLNTDILTLADRPLGSTEESEEENPRMTNPDCTVCHIVMEPISGAFKNYSRGFGVEYRPRKWYDDMQVPGVSVNKPLPADKADNALAWLAYDIVRDPRFARSATHIFYKALTGRTPLKATLANQSVEFAQALAFEDQVFSAITRDFVLRGMNAKYLIKALIKSPLYRGSSLPEGDYNKVINSNIGLSALLIPENLNEKIKDSTGYYWVGNTSYYSNDIKQEEGSRYQLLLKGYNLFYGGMDSVTVMERKKDLNGIMANVQLRLASEMSCKVTPIDFSFAAAERKMFPFVEMDLEPISDENITLIKKNIQYLHKKFLNEDLDITDSQIDATYELFLDTYTEGKANVADESESKYLRCQMTRDPITGVYLDYSDRISKDESYVIRSWSIVIAYLLSDYKYLYNNTAK